jgi:choline kinase
MTQARKNLSMHEPIPQANRITTACILAAGTGSRLSPLTENVPKCLTEVHGRPILERLVTSLRANGFTRLVFVVGHLEDCIRSFLEIHAADLTVEYVVNPVYATTNNLYSLWLTRDQFQEPFLLIESDLVFDSSLLDKLEHPDQIAVSHQLPWMNGTTVGMDAVSQVSDFHLSGDSKAIGSRYKTVNVCTLSPSSWKSVVTRLDQYVSEGRVNEYYEAVFRALVSEGILNFECVFFDEHRWYEIDTADDLRGANKMFAPSGVGAPGLPISRI